MAVELKEADFDAAVARGVTLVDFWASWCQPCRMLGAILEKQVEPRLAELGVRLCKVNVEDAPDLAARLDIQSIPALLVYRDGAQAARLDGIQKPDAILAAVNGAL